MAVVSKFQFPDEVPNVGKIVQIRFVDEAGNDYVLETRVIARIRIKNEKVSQIHLHLQAPNSFFDSLENLGELVLTAEYASFKPINK